MSPSPEITMRLASRLKEERTAKGLSLEALAKLSGVSRSMLSQIERGESSPTVASLWNLTRALNVEFSELLDEETDSRGPIVEFLRNDQVPFIERKGSGCIIRILSAPEDVGGIWGYDEYLKAIADPKHERHKELVEWGGEFDPEEFDAAETTTMMRQGLPRFDCW